jgi:hypothetical protein
LVYVLNNPVNGIDPSGLRCLFFEENCDEVAEKAWDWVTDKAQDATTLPWRLFPGDICLPGNLGCWGGKEYAGWLENENYPSLSQDLEWMRYHPAQAWGLPEHSLKTMIIENWFFEVGPDFLSFDERHPTTQLLKHHSGVNAARVKFYGNKCDRTTHWYDAKQGREKNDPALLLIAIPAHIRSLFYEVVFQIPDSMKTIEGTLGSYLVSIENNEDGTATFSVRNTTGWESGTFGIIKNKSRGETGPNWLSEHGVGGSLRQEFLWNEPIVLGLCDCR